MDMTILTILFVLRKIAEKELELIIEEIETICQIKEFELNDYSMYLVNESFKKN